MKILSCLFVSGLLAVFAGGCAKKEAAAPASARAAEVAAPGADSVVPATPSPAFVDWAQLKGYSFDRRGEVLAGLPGLEAQVDAEIAELTARRAGFAATTDTRDWDFNMKELQEARAYLKSVNAELRKASSDTWDQQKDKVGQAWTRAQDAYAKVKTSTTS